jgi:hypothetical protein
VKRFVDSGGREYCEWSKTTKQCPNAIPEETHRSSQRNRW